jgi:hypothetical protein
LIYDRARSNAWPVSFLSFDPIVTLRSIENRREAHTLLVHITPKGVDRRLEIVEAELGTHGLGRPEIVRIDRYAECVGNALELSGMNRGDLLAHRTRGIGIE